MTLTISVDVWLLILVSGVKLFVILLSLVNMGVCLVAEVSVPRKGRKYDHRSCQAHVNLPPPA